MKYKQGDSDKHYFGTSDDGERYYNGTANKLVIKVT